jgi:hypothetical protein
VSMAKRSPAAQCPPKWRAAQEREIEIGGVLLVAKAPEVAHGGADPKRTSARNRADSERMVGAARAWQGPGYKC